MSDKLMTAEELDQLLVLSTLSGKPIYFSARFFDHNIFKLRYSNHTGISQIFKRGEWRETYWSRYVIVELLTTGSANTHAGPLTLMRFISD